MKRSIGQMNRTDEKIAKFGQIYSLMKAQKIDPRVVYVRGHVSTEARSGSGIKKLDVTKNGVRLVKCATNRDTWEIKWPHKVSSASIDDSMLLSEVMSNLYNMGYDPIISEMYTVEDVRIYGKDYVNDVIESVGAEEILMKEHRVRTPKYAFGVECLTAWDIARYYMDRAKISEDTKARYAARIKGLNIVDGMVFYNQKHQFEPKDLGLVGKDTGHVQTEYRNGLFDVVITPKRFISETNLYKGVMMGIPGLGNLGI